MRDAGPDNHARLRQVAAATFRTTPDQLPADPAQGNTRGWDSLGHLRLILAIESAFHVKFVTTRIPQLKSLDLIAQELKSYGR